MERENLEVEPAAKTCNWLVMMIHQEAALISDSAFYRTTSVVVTTTTTSAILPSDTDWLRVDLSGW